MALKPPSASAIKRVMDILIDDMQNVNGLSPLADSDISYDKIVEHVRILDVSVHALQEEVKARTITLHRRRNAHALFLQLPPEIFGEILYLAVKDEDKPTHRSRQLCLVGKAWYPVIRSTPYLWRFIDDTDSLKQVKEALELSRDLPLRIKFIGQLEREVDVFLRESHRWESLDVHDHGREMPSMATLLSATTPKLTCLTIRAPTFRRARPPVAELGHGSNLHYLTLWGASMVWETNRLSGLVNLWLDRISQPPSVSRLLEILQASPQLSVLDLNEWPGWEDATPSPPTLPSLSFPYLTRLHLSKIPTAYTLSIMKNVQAPQCSDLSLAYLTDPDCGLFEPGDSGFASLISRLLTQREGTDDDLHITMYSDYLVFSSGGMNGFLLSLHHQDPPHCLLSVAAFISRFKITQPISIDTHSWTGPIHPFPVTALDYLPPTVKRLNASGDYKPTMEYLSRPRKGSDGRYEWPCPTLESLQFHSEKYERLLDEDAVLAFLSGRWGRANIPPETSDYVHPRKLEYLLFQYFTSTPESVQNIYEIEEGLFNFKHGSADEGVVYSPSFGFRASVD
ncbi:hypothetical protein FRB99_005312 [Tulasnella sp. 403]|nr:hypothetical protein FRB99_005312 [Tulasnella sp. 403]